MDAQSSLGLFGIIPKDIHNIIISQSPYHFWSLNKYFRELSCCLLKLNIKNYVLSQATTEGILDLVEYILRDEHISAYRIDWSLDDACEKGHLEVVDRLLKYPVDHSNAIQSPLRMCIVNDRLEVLNRLLQEPSIDPNTFSHNIFLYASECEHSRIFDYLLQHPRVDPSAQQNLPLTLASKEENLVLIGKLLKDPRVNPSDNGNSALRHTVYSSRPRALDMLLQDSRVVESFGINIAIGGSLRERKHVLSKMLYDRGYANPSAKHNAFVSGLYLTCIEIAFELADSTNPPGESLEIFQKHLELLEEVLRDARLDQNHPGIMHIKQFIHSPFATQFSNNRPKRDRKKRKIDHYFKSVKNLHK